MDLYEILGLDKKADKEDIKKSYRDKSKKTHPDIGGDAKEFQLIVTAYKILSDDKKRSRYDKGESVDNIEKHTDIALEMVKNLLIETISSLDVDRIDIVEEIRKKIVGHISKVDDAIKGNQRTIKKFESAIKRLKSKKNSKIFQELIATKIVSFELNIKLAESDKENLNKALDILDDLSYDFDFILNDVTLDDFVKGKSNNDNYYL